MKNLINNNIPEKVPEIGILEWYHPGEYEQVEQSLEDLKKLGITKLRTGISWADCFRDHVAKYDCILTYGGGEPVIKAYKILVQRLVYPIYNALDIDIYFPVNAVEGFKASLSFLGNRLPDREERVMDFFYKTCNI